MHGGGDFGAGMTIDKTDSMREAAARGLIAIQRCLECGRTHYPPREICPSCLCDNLGWDTAISFGGELIAESLLRHSMEDVFRDRLPIRVGLVRFDSGPTAVVFVAGGCVAGGRVTVGARLDEQGRPVLTASPI